MVGPSECGLAAVEVLLLDEHLHFSSITLLCPEEHAVGSMGDSLSGSNLHKLGLASRVNLVVAEMISLDREERRIGLSNGEEISYDYLLLTAGLQVNEHKANCKLDASEKAALCSPHLAYSWLHAVLQDQTKRYLQRTSESSFSSVVSVQSLLAVSQRESGHPQNVIVYGATIDACHALSLLASKGGENLCVRHVIPETPTEGVVLCVQKAAETLNLNMPEPSVMTLVEVEEMADHKLICAFEVIIFPNGNQEKQEHGLNPCCLTGYRRGHRQI